MVVKCAREGSCTSKRPSPGRAALTPITVGGFISRNGVGRKIQMQPGKVLNVPLCTSKIEIPNSSP